MVEVGDIIIMDGHVNNYEIINPVTGLPKRMITVGAIDGRSQFLAGYEIAITENVMSIASAIRRSILNLGKFPKVVYIDNGKAFSAKYFHQSDLENLEPLFARLGIKTIFAKAYHAQSKPIEPFWDWMAELERLIPTYVGTSIEMQPPRMNRGEFIHRGLYEKAMQNTTVDLFAAHRAMAWWLDQYHNRVKESGHLKGLTPLQVFNEGRGEGVDKSELNFLMMDTQITKLYRKGIRAFGTWYWNDSLFGKQIDAGDEIYFKYDLAERNSILVYDVEGNFVCEAFDVKKVHPAAALLGSPEQAEEVKNQLALKERLKKSVVGSYKEYVETEIFPEVKQRLKDANIIQIESPSPTSEVEDPDSIGGQGGGEVAAKKKKKRGSILDRWSEPVNDNKKKRNLG
jgi:putative transposase